MTIAVTAASGNLGQLILPRLIEAVGTDQVVAIARDPDKVTTAGVEVRQADYEIGKDWPAAMAGVAAS